MAKAKPPALPDHGTPDSSNPLPVDGVTIEAPRKLVVVGSSAGGIEALSVLVSTLAADFPAPVVLAQHLDPLRHSNLENILRHRSTLPVVLVHERTRLEVGTVYVVPANHHVTIQDDHLDLDTARPDRPRPSVDVLLTSAAVTYGDNLVAVILTGSGHDGAAGAVEVHNAGGTVIIQNPVTALYPAMPLALPPTVVDYVVDLADLSALLLDVLRGVSLPPELDTTTDPLRDILAQVSRQANIDFSLYKPTTILRRIGRRMTVTHSQSIQDYSAYLDAHPAEIAELVMAFLIKVTEFFRDPEAFAYLRSTVLPAIIHKARTRDRTLRFWSAGCATGEEAYSLALLLADLLDSELAEWNVKIFATDLDENAVAFARRGVFPPNLLTQLPDNYLLRFFEQIGPHYRVGKVPRQLVIFGRQDLSRGVPFPRMDLVLCRNVLIYFKPELQQNVLAMFAYSLQQTTGYLFLGQAETIRPSKISFELLTKRWKFYQCINGPLPGTTRQEISAMNLPNLPPIQRGRHPLQSAEAAGEPDPTDEGPLLQLRRFNEWVLRFSPTGVVVIDRSYHIVTLNPTARRLLGIREMSNEQDFLHAVRGLPYTQLRSAVDSVFRDHTTLTLPDLPLEPAVSGEERYLTLSLVLMHMDAGAPDLAMISVTDTTEQVQIRRRLEAVQQKQQTLLDELGAANGRFSDLNRELQEANEELQAANEEMMLTQEELQATNEEFEATNEELQATNEELETNNEELQATNEELETTNEELAARSGELAELSRTLADERARLHSIVALAPFYVMVLRGPQLLINLINPLYEQLLAGRVLIGQLFDELFADPLLTAVPTAVREVYRSDTARITTPLPGPLPLGDAPHPSLFRYTIIPMHDSSDRVDGIILYAEAQDD